MTTDRFLELYCTRTGAWLANRLGLRGPGRERLAALVSNYAWNTRAMKACRTEAARNTYAHAVRMCHEEIHAHPLYGQLGLAVKSMVR